MPSHALTASPVQSYDTDHPHAHVVVRGVDREGREVRLDRGYISNRLRWRAQELATEELGPRLAMDIRLTHAREVNQERFTSLDRELERRAQDQRVEPRSRGAGRIDASVLIGRLEYLEDLRLAERVGPGAWSLSPGWKEELQELGARSDILKQIHKAIPDDRVHDRIVRDGQALEAGGGRKEGVLCGRVASKGLSDEAKGRFYAVLETPRGEAFHVPLDARAAEELRKGDVVTFTTRPAAAVRPVDREIAEVARVAGGICVLPATDERTRPHARRLRELERLGLAATVAPERWRVAPNLLEELERRQREGPPRHRLFVRKEPLSLEQQVRHVGPTWLDRLTPGSLAHFGFGAQLRPLVEARREALRQMGVAPDDVRREGKLCELERRAVGKAIAGRTGLAFVERVPDGFQGRAGIGDTSGPGSGYLMVSDGARFVLLRATPTLRANVGTVVTVARDDKSPMLVRSVAGKDRGS